MNALILLPRCGALHRGIYGNVIGGRPLTDDGEGPPDEIDMGICELAAGHHGCHEDFDIGGWWNDADGDFEEMTTASRSFWLNEETGELEEIPDEGQP